MSANKVEFNIEINEENKGFSFSWLLIVLFIGLIISSLFFINRTDGSSVAEMTATQWANAKLNGNQSMMYNLLSDREKNKLLEQYQEIDDKQEGIDEFKQYNLFQWKRSNNEYIFKFHYYDMESCKECQKDIWVRVKVIENAWKVDDLHFTAVDATPLIENLKVKEVPVPSGQKEKQEGQSLFQKIFQLIN
jgi:hypothetical protein